MPRPGQKLLKLTLQVTRVLSEFYRGGREFSRLPTTPGRKGGGGADKINNKICTAIGCSTGQDGNKMDLRVPLENVFLQLMQQIESNESSICLGSKIFKGNETNI